MKGCDDVTRSVFTSAVEINQFHFCCHTHDVERFQISVDEPFFMHVAWRKRVEGWELGGGRGREGGGGKRRELEGGLKGDESFFVHVAWRKRVEKVG